jgi:uncharacterized membrane protein
MSPVIGLGLLLTGLLYPFAVYYGMAHFAPWQFALLLGSLWLARAVTGKRRPGDVLMAGAVLLFCLLLALFGASLKYGPPMVERLARLREPQLPQKAIRYTRHVTIAWCLFFLCNGLCAAALTLWAPLSWWALYTGLISYVLIGLMFAIEWLIRQRVRGHP